MHATFIREHSAHAIHSGLKVGHCPLCRATLSTFLAELPCPHWFLIHGARGFRLDKLAQTFALYEPQAVMEYLRIVAEFDTTRSDGLAPYTESLSGAQREVTLHWRDRTWVFGHAIQGAADSASITSFTLSVYFRSELVGKDLIELGAMDVGPKRTILSKRPPKNRKGEALSGCGGDEQDRLDNARTDSCQ